VVPHQGRRGVAVAMLRVTLPPAICPTCGCSSNSRTKCGSAWPLDSVFTKSRFCNSLPHGTRRSIARVADSTSWRLHRSHVSRGFKEVDQAGGYARREGVRTFSSVNARFFPGAAGANQKNSICHSPTEQLSGARKRATLCGQ
jgi:hypothetical protein